MTYRKAAGMAALLMAGASANALMAQAATQDGLAPRLAPQSEAPAVGEIIVTAQRRSESLSRTPVAVDVLSADELAQANIASEQDLRTATPGLSVRTGLNSNNLNYSLRGQSQDPYSSTRPGVLPYVNEVQVGGAGGAGAASSAFYDLANIQVLKGPQGTLFGRSATGGAVLFTTRKPDDALEGYISGLVGNYDARKVEGAIGGPIDSRGIVKLRVAGVYQERDGYQRNLYDGRTIGDFERTGLRGTLVFDSLDGMTNELTFDYYDSKGSNITGFLAGLMPFTGSAPPYVPLTLLYGGTASPGAVAAGVATLQAFTGADAATAEGFYRQFFAGREGTSLESLAAAQAGRSPYEVDYNGHNSFDVKNRVLTNITTVPLGDNLKLRNVFGLVKTDSVNGVDADGTPFTISQGREPSLISQNSRQVSEELQLQGASPDGRLDYVLGGYYSTERLIQQQDSAFFDILFGGGAQTFAFRLANETLAGYAQATYDLTGSGLGLTLGGRYTDEKVTKTVLPMDSAFGLPGLVTRQDRRFKTFSWQIGLKQEISPDLLTYVVSRRAYKSGGFNGTVPAIPGVDDFDAERVTDVELGAKFNGRIAALPTRVNLALYHNWVRNSQRAAYAFIGGNPAGLTINVPKGKVYGLEADASIQPASWLTLGGSFNYTHAGYASDPVDLIGTPTRYDQVTDTPRYSGSAYADVEVPIAGNLVGKLHGDVFAQSRTFTSPVSRNNQGATISGYSLVTVRAGVEDKAAGWSLVANVKNLLDQRYYVGGQATGEIYQINLLVPGEPRTFTLEARYNF